MDDFYSPAEAIYCPICAGIQWDSIHIGKQSSFFICPNCKNYPVRRYDDRCDACKYVIPGYYFRDLQAKSYDYIISLDPVSEVAASYNLCCNKSEFKCDCINPIYWDSVKDKVSFMYLDIFTFFKDAASMPQTSCVECARYQTPGCIPLRSSLRKWFEGETGDDPLLITPCSLYLTDEEYYKELEEMTLVDIMKYRNKQLEDKELEEHLY